MNRTKCPRCHDLMVYPSGPADSNILLVGEFPGHEEIRQGLCFVGQTGAILKAELAKIGIQFSAVRATNLWQHYKDEDACDIEWHKEKMFNEFKNKKYILLMGSDVSTLLFNKGVMELSGLKMKHPLFPNIVFVVSPNPAILMHGPIGEFRLALNNFKKEMK